MTVEQEDALIDRALYEAARGSGAADPIRFTPETKSEDVLTWLRRLIRATAAVQAAPVPAQKVNHDNKETQTKPGAAAAAPATRRTKRAARTG